MHTTQSRPSNKSASQTVKIHPPPITKLMPTITTLHHSPSSMPNPISLLFLPALTMSVEVEIGPTFVFSGKLVEDLVTVFEVVGLRVKKDVVVDCVENVVVLFVELVLEDLVDDPVLDVLNMPTLVLRIKAWVVVASAASSDEGVLVFVLVELAGAV
jgi:hypothetical protein